MFDVFLFLGGDAVCYQDIFEFRAFEGFHFHQFLCDGVECRAVLGEYVLRFFVGGQDNFLHFRINLRDDDLRGLVAFHAFAEYRALRRRGKCDGPHFVGHTVPRDHIARECGQYLQVIGGAGRHVVEYHFLRDEAAKRYCNVVQKFFARLHATVFKRKLERVARRAAARDDGNLVHGVGIRQDRRDECVPCFVVGGNFFLLFVEHVRAAFGPEHHLLYRADGVVLRDFLSIFTGGEDGAFVHQAREVGAAKSRCALGDDDELHICTKRLGARMHLEDFFAVHAVGQVYHHAAIEAAGAQKRGVEHVGSVGCGHYDDFLIGLEAVHFNEDLIERLFAFVVAATDARTAHAPHCIYFVNENNRGRRFLCGQEEVAHARSADADEHLDELGARDGKERHTGFAGDRASKQCVVV